MPWLILFTCLLVGAQPRISRWLRPATSGEAPEPRTRMSPVTTFFATLTGVYGGYFGAGSGVMVVAVLGLGLDLELRILNALKTLAVMAANVVASVIFVSSPTSTGGRSCCSRRLDRGRLRRVAHRSAAPGRLLRVPHRAAGVTAAVTMLM